MWDSCFKSIKSINSEEGSGCILAHDMGLGKTLQIIALIHTILNHSDTKVKTIMIICPKYTIQNWVNEFESWLRDIDGVKVDLYYNM